MELPITDNTGSNDPYPTDAELVAATLGGDRQALAGSPDQNRKTPCPRTHRREQVERGVLILATNDQEERRLANLEIKLED